MCLICVGISIRGSKFAVITMWVYHTAIILMNKWEGAGGVIKLVSTASGSLVLCYQNVDVSLLWSFSWTSDRATLGNSWLAWGSRRSPTLNQFTHITQYSLPMRRYKMMDDNKPFHTVIWRHHSVILPGSIRRKCWVLMSISDSASIRMRPGHLHSFRPSLCLTTWLNTLSFPCVYI